MNERIPSPEEATVQEVCSTMRVFAKQGNMLTTEFESIWVCKSRMPYAISVVFTDATGAVEWNFARDLIRDIGNATGNDVTGYDDLKFRHLKQPTPFITVEDLTVSQYVIMELRSPHGQADLAVPYNDLCQFVADTNSLIKEDESVNYLFN